MIRALKVKGACNYIKQSTLGAYGLMPRCRRPVPSTFGCQLRAFANSAAESAEGEQLGDWVTSKYKRSIVWLAVMALTCSGVNGTLCHELLSGLVRHPVRLLYHNLPAICAWQIVSNICFGVCSYSRSTGFTHQLSGLTLPTRPLRPQLHVFLVPFSLSSSLRSVKTSAD
jgi:hypothetical protein